MQPIGSNHFAFIDKFQQILTACMQILESLKAPSSIPTFPTSSEVVVIQYENSFLAQRTVHNTGDWTVSSEIHEESIAAAQDRAQAWLEIGCGYILESMVDGRRHRSLGSSSLWSMINIQTKYVNKKGCEYTPNVRQEEDASSHDSESYEEDSRTEEELLRALGVLIDPVANETNE